MSELFGAVRLSVLAEIGARAPGFVPRVVLAAVGALLCFDRFPPGFWLIVGLVLTALAAAVPRLLAAWALILLLGASQLVRHPSPLHEEFFVLLAGVHLLHVLASMTLVLPVGAWVQLAVFRRPLLRFLVIQVPVQIVAVLVLILLAPGPNGNAVVALPVLGIIGAAALVLMTLLLIVPLLREGA